jgi:hypothetical protein
MSKYTNASNPNNVTKTRTARTIRRKQKGDCDVGILCFANENNSQYIGAI